MVDYFKDVPGINELSEGFASIHTNPKLEDQLRKVGFDIPKYPKSGDVTFNGKKVGRMDNFNGLMISNKVALQAIKKAIPKIGIWNPDNVTESKLHEGESWSQQYLSAREKILETFEMVEEDLNRQGQDKLFDKLDKAQRDWIKTDRVIQSVLKKWDRLPG